MADSALRDPNSRDKVAGHSPPAQHREEAPCEGLKCVNTLLLDRIPQMLEAQSECQVLQFLCNYLSSTVLDACAVQALLDQV
jgi:hypothetical protein